MPPSSAESSTVRRHRLAAFIDSCGDVIVQKCSTCNKHKRVCKVYLQLGKCSECVKRGQRCDVRVTRSEFDRLLKEKEKLLGQLKESREAQDAALRAQDRALEDLRVARAREERLRQQIDLIDRRSGEAIAVESRNLDLLEFIDNESSSLEGPSDRFKLALSPSTWNAFEGFPLDFPDVALPSNLLSVPSMLSFLYTIVVAYNNSWGFF